MVPTTAKHRAPSLLRGTLRAAAWGWVALAAVWALVNLFLFSGEAADSAASPASVGYSNVSIGDHWTLLVGRRPGMEALRFSREPSGMGPGRWDAEGGGGGELAPFPNIEDRHRLLDQATTLGPTAVIERRSVGVPLKIWAVWAVRESPASSPVLTTRPVWRNLFLTLVLLGAPSLVAGCLTTGMSYRKRRSRIRAGLCASCGYPLSGASACPECGK